MRVDRIRGRALQRIRTSHLSMHPLCVRCAAKGRITEATQVDHIVPLYKGGCEQASNRQSLCDDCHRSKTAEDMGYAQRARIGPDGYPIEEPSAWPKRIATAAAIAVCAVTLTMCVARSSHALSSLEPRVCKPDIPCIEADDVVRVPQSVIDASMQRVRSLIDERDSLAREVSRLRAKQGCV